MSYSNGLLPNNYFPESSSGGVAGRDGRDGIGFKLTDDGDYDIQNKKLVNGHRSTRNDYAITVDKNLLSSSSQNIRSGNIPTYDSHNTFFCHEINILR